MNRIGKSSAYVACASLGAALCVSLLTGCAAFPPASAPPPAASAPTSAKVGDTTIVAIQPAPASAASHNLLQFSGIPALGKGLYAGVSCVVNGVRNRLGSRFPGLEAKPPLKSITDPANLDDSASPAVKVAAEVKAEEDAAAQKIKGLRYLATIGCGGCYAGVEEALLAGLDDCTEEVRFEAAKALRSTVGSPCKFCKSGDCCSSDVRKKLRSIAYDIDATGCYVEPSERVRRFARLALCGCGNVEEIVEEVPAEGPDWDGTIDAEATASATTEEQKSSSYIQSASIHLPTTAGATTGAEQQLEISPSIAKVRTPTGSTPSALSLATHSQFSQSLAVQANPTVRVGAVGIAPTAYRSAPTGNSLAPAAEQRGRQSGQGVVGPKGEHASDASNLREYVTWEQVVVDPKEFDSVERARQTILYIRGTTVGQQVARPSFSQEEISVERFDWTEINEIQADPIRHAILELNAGQVSRIVTHNNRWYLIRLLARASR